VIGFSVQAQQGRCPKARFSQEGLALVLEFVQGHLEGHRFKRLNEGSHAQDRMGVSIREVSECTGVRFRDAEARRALNIVR
jgi:hypothetical protein